MSPPLPVALILTRGTYLYSCSKVPSDKMILNGNTVVVLEVNHLFVNECFARIIGGEVLSCPHFLAAFGSLEKY